ncbi:O-methyltransferase [Azospirillum picis]|uniref:O-methyltransferase YrrM n=1 Tax=Azospirillum picis TaxID=488438 RepID=A0ABU0MTG2_9PROT|nr:class I SAM-dependent methyltransferase [Azospirillum picis]MBP2303000.1 putative O-methyltransferase YrrM [Azospirillum picis]MDQ0536752.1 putative O-methyltransferase YrrM [Azospirillum picis]
MTTLDSERISVLLDRLHQDAEAADRTLVEEVVGDMAASGKTMEQLAAELISEERSDMRSVYRRHADHFLSVSPAYGRFLYAMARACRATRIVEFGTSMGVSAIYLAAALRDNGGGKLIGTELEPGKVARARAHIATAGLADLVEIREGDARETLADVGGPVDLLHIDGAWSLYLPILKLVEPRLRPGSVVLAENAFADDYLTFMRNPTNGYLSQPIPVDEGRGNEFAVKVD